MQTQHKATGAVKTLQRLAEGQITSRELLEQQLETIETHNPSVNAVVTLDAKRARHAADAADRARKEGKSLGPLHGLPMTVKDTYQTAGLKTVCGAKRLRKYVPTEDATAVARLKAAGAIIIGKTNVPPYASDIQTDNPVFGVTNNPWNLDRTPGGSSGGAAVALATGMTPLEFGSDLAGSLRIPASFCGVWSHKPSSGLVPFYGHIPGPPGTRSEPDLAVGGPMGRSAADLRLALSITAGPGALEGRAFSLSLPEEHRRLSKMRVAVLLDHPEAPVDDKVGRVLQQTVRAMRDCGVHVTTLGPSDFDFLKVRDAYEQLMLAVIEGALPKELIRAGKWSRWATRRLASQPWMSSFAPRLLQWIPQRHSEWLAANEARHKLRHEAAAFLERYDVVIMPCFQTTALPHDPGGSLMQRKMTINGRSRPVPDTFFWVSMATALGLPATTVPVGLASDGLPVGVQVLAGPYKDMTALAAAEELATMLPAFPEWSP